MTTNGSWRAAQAGMCYFAIVFAAGFVLGTMRVLLFAPLFGETAMVAAELPIMLAISWFACRWLLERFDIPASFTARLLMGATAFGLLMLAEVCISLVVLGRSFVEHLAHYTAPAGQLGLAGQLAFAGFPLLQRRS